MKYLFPDVDDCVGVWCGAGTCVDGIASHTCDCDVGFTGDSCETSKLYNRVLLVQQEQEIVVFISVYCYRAVCRVLY